MQNVCVYSFKYLYFVQFNAKEFNIEETQFWFCMDCFTEHKSDQYISMDTDHMCVHVIIILDS